MVSTISKVFADTMSCCWLDNLNQYSSYNLLRHIFACLLVFETGLSCFTHLFYLVILLCLTQPITVFCNIDFVFQSLNFMVWSRNGWFQLLHLIFKLAFFFHQQLIFYDFASRFSNFGPIWVFICCNPQICADNLVTRAWLFLRCASSFWLSLPSHVPMHFPFQVL